MRQTRTADAIPLRRRNDTQSQKPPARWAKARCWAMAASPARVRTWRNSVPRCVQPDALACSTRRTFGGSTHLRPGDVVVVWKLDRLSWSLE
jgi:hypothetical protein